MTSYIEKVYSEIFNEPFDYAVASKRHIFQATIYLLENFGYDFDLEDTDKTKHVFSKIRSIADAKPENLSLEEWLNTVTSMHYLLRHSHFTRDKVFKIFSDIASPKNADIQNKAIVWAENIKPLYDVG